MSGEAGFWTETRTRDLTVILFDLAVLRVPVV